MMQKTAPLCASLAAAFAVLAAPTTAEAVTLPAIKASQSNTVPSCATPGRLMAYLKDNNPRVQSHFEDIATHYMRHGEPLGLRWDYAFFQMLVETGFLRFGGDVKWQQNNFAGLGATGGGVRGEAFKSVRDGVKAHLEHLLMYTGTHIENPTAERTRKIQEWKVLTKWQQQFKRRPMTFKDMARRWAPSSRGYPRDIEFVGERFYGSHCNRKDPAPQLVLAARGGKQKTSSAAKSAHVESKTIDTKPGTLRTAAKTARPNSSLDSRYNLGVGQTDNGSAKKTNQTKKKDTIQTASIAGAGNQTAKTTKANTKPLAKKATCRVWSASYGGTKAVIIKAMDKQVTNYTVLKVNDGRVQPEAKAYIRAYARGGELLNQFPNPDQALEKAFQLCPEG